jgi:hypothetical protein
MLDNTIGRYNHELRIDNMRHDNTVLKARYWATMVTARRLGGDAQVRVIGPADDEEALDVLIAREWRRAERAGLMVCDVRERMEG